MKLDYYIKSIFAEIREELGIKMSDRELREIVVSQYLGALYAMAKGVDQIELFKFAKIKRRYFLEIVYSRREVLEVKAKFGKEAAAKKRLEMQMKTKELNKERKANLTTLTIEELHELEFINKTNVTYAKRDVSDKRKGKSGN